MNYQFILNNATVAQGDLGAVMIAVFSILIILIIVTILIMRSLRESETLKNEFITIVAHKFRTPLTRVKWIIDQTIADEQDIVKRQNFIDMQKANEELISLTSTMIQLTSSNKQVKVTYTMEPVALCDFVREAGSTLKLAFSEKNISFAVACADPSMQVRIDKNSMAFALQTLMRNACLYTPPGKRVDVNVYREKNKAVISIIDNGIGIEPKDINRIFEKFYRAQNAQDTSSDGFGVSLYMTKDIIHRHRGKITASSAGRNQGSTFTVTLPLIK